MQTSSEEAVSQSRKPRRDQNEESLYDNELYSLPKGTNISDVSEPWKKMNRKSAVGKENCPKNYKRKITGSVIGCLLAFGIVTTCYIGLNRHPETDEIHHPLNTGTEGRSIKLKFGKEFNMTYQDQEEIKLCVVKKLSSKLDLRKGFQTRHGHHDSERDNAKSTDRIHLIVSGNQCAIYGTKALKKDAGLWNFKIMTEKDGLYHTRHIHFHANVVGTMNETIARARYRKANNSNYPHCYNSSYLHSDDPYYLHLHTGTHRIYHNYYV